MKNIPDTTCAICMQNSVTGTYPHVVCRKCDARAVDSDGRNPTHDNAPVEGDTALYESDEGANPVFIDGIKCWRRYRFGGYVTMRDVADCDTLTGFMTRVFKPFKGIPK